MPRSTIVAWLLVAALAPALAPAPALADADPASDVLLGTSVFYPYSPPVSGSLQKQLNAEAAAAARAHFPIKIAVIASPVDLGALPTMFAKAAKGDLSPDDAVRAADKEVKRIFAKWRS